MKKQDTEIIGYYSIENDTTDYWQPLVGLSFPVRRLFEKFAQNNANITLFGDDVLDVMAESGRPTDIYEQFRRGYVDIPTQIGRLSLLSTEI